MVSLNPCSQLESCEFPPMFPLRPLNQVVSYLFPQALPSRLVYPHEYVDENRNENKDHRNYDALSIRQMGLGGWSQGRPPKRRNTGMLADFHGVNRLAARLPFNWLIA